MLTGTCGAAAVAMACSAASQGHAAPGQWLGQIEQSVVSGEQDAYAWECSATGAGPCRKCAARPLERRGCEIESHPRGHSGRLRARPAHAANVAPSESRSAGWSPGPAGPCCIVEAAAVVDPDPVDPTRLGHLRSQVSHCIAANGEE